MLLTLENTRGHPCRIIDATGEEVRYCVEADTVSGRVVVLQRDADGVFMISDGEGVRQVRVVPAPLRVVWDNPLGPVGACCCNPSA